MGSQSTQERLATPSTVDYRQCGCGNYEVKMSGSRDLSYYTRSDCSTTSYVSANMGITKTKLEMSGNRDITQKQLAAQLCIHTC